MRANLAACQAQRSAKLTTPLYFVQYSNLDTVTVSTVSLGSRAGLASRLALAVNVTSCMGFTGFDLPACGMTEYYSCNSVPMGRAESSSVGDLYTTYTY